MKLSAETMLATARLQIELLNNQLEEERRRSGDLQAELDRLRSAERVTARQAPGGIHCAAGSFHDGERGEAGAA